MSDLNELFAELKAEVISLATPNNLDMIEASHHLYELDWLINNGEFARAEQDAYIG